MKNVNVVKTPVVEDLITKLRDVDTNSELFRIYLDRITKLLLYEAMVDLKMAKASVLTQTGTKYAGKRIGEKVAFIAILRASLGMLSSAMDFYPNGEFHVLGMKRNEEDPYKKEPHFYLDRLHEMGTVDCVIVMDPMLATGKSMICALQAIREKHKFEGRIQVISLICAATGAQSVIKKFPSITITCAGLDQELNKNAYIIPGLGDAGDRLFGIHTDLRSIR